MRKIYSILFVSVLGFVLWGCHDITVGYLQTGNAVYLPDTLEVRRVLDPTRSPDNKMIITGADWASNPISGVLGTDPILYEIAGVTAKEGGNAQLFLEQVRVIGGGRIYFPSKDIKAPNGTYVVSVRVSNPGYTVELKEVFTIIIK